MQTGKEYLVTSKWNRRWLIWLSKSTFVKDKFYNKLKTMSTFKHHSRFPKEKAAQNYLFPNLCFACRKSFKKPHSTEPRICPECGAPMVEVTRKFSAPKSSNFAQWEKVIFLVQHGFLFQSIYAQKEDGLYYKVNYLRTLKEAHEFVINYRQQALPKSPCNREMSNK